MTMSEGVERFVLAGEGGGGVCEGGNASERREKGENYFSLFEGDATDEKVLLAFSFLVFSVARLHLGRHRRHRFPLLCPRLRRQLGRRRRLRRRRRSSFLRGFPTPLFLSGLYSGPRSRRACRAAFPSLFFLCLPIPTAMSEGRNGGEAARGGGTRKKQMAKGNLCNYRPFLFRFPLHRREQKTAAAAAANRIERREAETKKEGGRRRTANDSDDRRLVGLREEGRGK
jgi:hypothetical protein